MFRNSLHYAIFLDGGAFADDIALEKFRSIFPCWKIGIMDSAWMEQTIQFSGLLSNHGIDDDSCIGTTTTLNNFTGINTGLDFK